jgi:hypothetical protein
MGNHYREKIKDNFGEGSDIIIYLHNGMKVEGKLIEIDSVGCRIDMGFRTTDGYYLVMFFDFESICGVGSMQLDPDLM